MDTFERVLQRIKPQSLYICLQIYCKDLISDLEGKHIAIDDKRLKGSKKKTGSTHILSAWVDEVGLSFAQETIAEKRNELQAIPKVLDSLDLSGAVISIDAMRTQTNIAEQIIQSEADYILSLKGNQKHLYEDVQDCFTGQYTCHRYENLEKDHGREKRTYTTLLTSDVFEADCIDGASDVFLKNLANSYTRWETRPSKSATKQKELLQKRVSQQLSLNTDEMRRTQ